MNQLSIKGGLLYGLAAYGSAQSVSSTGSCYWTTTVIYGDIGTWASHSGYTSSSTTSTFRSTWTTTNSIGGEPGVSTTTSPSVGPPATTSSPGSFDTTSDAPFSSSTDDQAASSTSTASPSPTTILPSPTSEPFVVQINAPNPTNLKLHRRDTSYLTFIEGSAYLTSYEAQAAIFVLTATGYLMSGGSYAEPFYEQYGPQYTRPESLPGAVPLQQTLALFENRYGWSFDDGALMLGNASFYVSDIGRLLVFFGGEGQPPDDAVIAELGVAFVDDTASSTATTTAETTSSVSEMESTSASDTATASPTASDSGSSSLTPTPTPTSTDGETSSSSAPIMPTSSPSSPGPSSETPGSTSPAPTSSDTQHSSEVMSSSSTRSTATTTSAFATPGTSSTSTRTGLISPSPSPSRSTGASASTQTPTSSLGPSSSPLAPPSSSSPIQSSTPPSSLSTTTFSRTGSTGNTSGGGTSSASVSGSGSVPISQSTSTLIPSTASSTRTISTGSFTTTTPVLASSSQLDSSSTSAVVSSTATAATQTITSTSSRPTSQTSSSTLISTTTAATTTTTTTSNLRTFTQSSSSSSSASSTTSSSSTPTSTPYPAKRGLAYTNVTTLVYYPPPSPYISWAYNYYSLPNASDNVGPYPSSQFRFIPLLFSDDPSLTSIWAANVNFSLANYGTDALFGFNEPDACFGGLSSCMPLNKSLQGYANFMQPFANRTTRQGGARVKIGSVAVTNAGQDGLDYLSQFLGNATQMNLTIDFLNLHWYASPYNIQYFKDYMTQAYNITGGARYPVWITEFGMDRSDYPAPVVQDFLRNASRWCDDTPWVERYAWFGNFKSDNGATNMLLNADGSGLSALGSVWARYNGTVLG